MRHLTKDPNAAAKARVAEQKANEEAGLKSLSLPAVTAATSNTGKKKPVFKSTLQPHNVAVLAHSVETKLPAGSSGMPDEDSDPSGAVRNGWFEDRYQPRFVTGCDDLGCKVCQRGFIDLGASGRDAVMSNA